MKHLTEEQYKAAQLEFETEGEYSGTADCEACQGQRISVMRERDCCEACYEDGGPHAGDDPFGRSDEDWARHAE